MGVIWNRSISNDIIWNLYNQKQPYDPYGWGHLTHSFGTWIPHALFSGIMYRMVFGFGVKIQHGVGPKKSWISSNTYIGVITNYI